MPINTQSYGNTQAHSEENQRDNGSVTHSNDKQILLADVQRAITGVPFPADKMRLAEHAEQHNAPRHIVDLIKQLPASEFGSENADHSIEYQNVEEVIREISKVEV